MDSTIAATGAEDTWYDGVDANCDGLDDFDQDQDGYRTSMHPDKDGLWGKTALMARFWMRKTWLDSNRRM